MRTRSGHVRRTGSAYIMVLGISVLLTVIGLGAMLAARAELRRDDVRGDAQQARVLAQSAVEVALLWMAQDPAWRSTRDDGVWIPEQRIGRGRYSVRVEDPVDHDLADDAMESVTIVGTGMAGQARQTLQVSVEPLRQARGCLESALHAGGGISFNSVVVMCNGLISSNASISAASSTVHGEIEAVGAVTGSAYVDSSPLSPVPLRTMPESTVFSTYAAMGTTIPFTSIPQAQGKRTLQNIVLSPVSNPFGSPNAQGIYVIDCGGMDLVIRTMRLLGTLVILNPGAGSKIALAVNVAPAVANYPSLLVDGSISIETASAVLEESSSTGSLNPPGAPYLGDADTDTTDTYPSHIEGLVFINGSVSTSNSPVLMDTLVVGGPMSAAGQLTLGYRETYIDDPPAGFSHSPVMTVLEGSWVRVIE